MRAALLFILSVESLDVDNNKRSARPTKFGDVREGPVAPIVSQKTIWILDSHGGHRVVEQAKLILSIQSVCHGAVTVEESSDCKRTSFHSPLTRESGSRLWVIMITVDIGCP